MYDLLNIFRTWALGSIYIYINSAPYVTQKVVDGFTSIFFTTLDFHIRVSLYTFYPKVPTGTGNPERFVNVVNSKEELIEKIFQSIETKISKSYMVERKIH